MKGIGASPGIVIGRVLIKKEPVIEIEKKDIENTTQEVEKLEKSLDFARKEIEEICKNAQKKMRKEEAKIFEAHLMMLEDPEVFGQVTEMIEQKKVNAEWALQEITQKFLNIFNSMDDEYIKERAADLKDVRDRVIRILLGIESCDLSNLPKEVIIVAEDLTPSDTAQMDKDKVLGFVTEFGGKTSHSAIMARTLGIPAVVGVNGITKSVNDDDLVIFDGEKGLVYINPDNTLIQEYIHKKEEYKQFKTKLNDLIGKESKTKDGFKVELSANIGTPKDVEAILRNDGEGIGLYRTEFLYMDRDSFPTEEEQFKAYKVVAERLKGKPVVIRTLDIGGDKELSYLDLPQEMNPFLGYRAIRLCLDREDIFRTQLRALLRASACGNIKIMFPMISSMEELLQAKEILRECQEELRKKKIDFNEEMEVGIMIEIPAAAIVSDMLAKEVDFFSIGTNDLIQYTTAVDRGNQMLSSLYTQFHPALLRLIEKVIDNGHQAGIWVGMCGEVAGDPKMIPVLIGMGLDEFSMSPGSLLKARWIINNISKKEMEKHIEALTNMSRAVDVEKYIDEKIVNQAGC